MRALLRFRRWYAFAALGLLIGSSVGIASTSLASSVERRSSAGPLEPVLDATHLPPLLTLPDEPVQLTYDVQCAPGSDDVDASCDVAGKVLARPVGGNTFAEIPLFPAADHGLQRLVASVPDALAETGFEYYAVIDAPAEGRSVTVPAGGASAPDVSRRMDGAVAVSLGRREFGRDRRLGIRVASVGWGDQPTEVGLEAGSDVDPIGASSFDVDASRAVFVLDEAHHRILRWDERAPTPSAVPVSVAGTIADLASGDDGSTYVLETTAPTGRNPLVKRFDEGGRELEAYEVAERAPSQIRMSPIGPVVLSHPSHHWLPVAPDGVPASPAEQLARGRPGRPVPGGRQVVVRRLEHELRLALMTGERIGRSWRVTSETPFAEVQLVEPLGRDLVVVARQYDERNDEFLALILDGRGVIDSFSLASADWAEAAPLARFRLVGRSLYRLGSTARGVFVDRFDLEPR